MAFTVRTDDRIDVIDITDRVVDALPAEEGGVCTVFVEHTTAGVCLNEAEPRLIADIEEFVRDLAPAEGWRHDELDGNADAHLRSMLVGRSVTVPIRDGQLDLGTWQSILVVECDGPRTRTVRVVVH
jgi:secondary thiamine-phosphate synthase enzyme